MGPKPVVTGLSPKEGPPGTKVTIRGEFLGVNVEDLIGLCLTNFAFICYKIIGFLIQMEIFEK